jgi:hypothetical protein
MSQRPAKVPERIATVPSGPDQLQQYDRPAFERRGIQLELPAARSDAPAPESAKERIDKNDTEKPAFLRKIMD